MKNDDFGNRMKSYEVIEAGRKFIPLLPIYARIDGRCFSKFTSGMNRPYDEWMSSAMIETTKYLVDETKACIGYTQSDEISLVWLQEDYKSEAFFGARIQKLCSVLASLATVKFNHICLESNYIAERAKTMLPVFDCRVFQLPNKTEAANVFLWREKDATKNAISMAAQAYYSHNELMGKSSSEKQEMLFQKGVNFNDYPAFFKRGTFIRKISEDRTLTQEELNAIPEKHRPKPWEKVTRSRMVEMNMPIFSSVINREAVIFDGDTPLVKDNFLGISMYEPKLENIYQGLGIDINEN